MYYFYKKHTLTAKSNRNRKKTLKAQFFFFPNGKSNSCGVLIAYFGTGTFIVKKEQTDKERCILILDVSINDSEYILINLYNANTENEQINVLSSPTIMTGDFNLFFNSELEAQGGNPILKIKNLQLNLLNLKRLMIYVIYRGGGVRILKSKRFTFTQKHSSGFIQRRLDYILISYTLQEFVTMTEILTPVSTDHSLVLFSL